MSCRGQAVMASSSFHLAGHLYPHIPVAPLIGGGGWMLPLDARQTEEFVLTAVQAVLGFAILADLRFNLTERVAFFIPRCTGRHAPSIVRLTSSIFLGVIILPRMNRQRGAKRRPTCVQG